MTIKEVTVQNQYFDRDLSWLTFNYRVLMEAQKMDVPVYERLRFLAIYYSNQDEFFRVRVASIRRLVEINKKKINKELDFRPKKLIEEIGNQVKFQLNEYGSTLYDNVLKELEHKGVYILKPKQLTKEQQSACLFYFKTKVLSFLQPYVFGISKRKKFLDNRGIYFALRLENHSTSNLEYAYLNIPSSELPRFYQLPSPNTQFHYIFLDDIICQNLDFMFPGYKILECKSIKINKDADLNIEDDFSGNLVEKIQKQVIKRNLGIPSRFLFDRSMTPGFVKYLQETFDLTDDDMVPGGEHHGLSDFLQLPNPIGTSLEYEPLLPLESQRINTHRSIFSAIDEMDHMLHFPYHTYDYILQFFSQAANDPDVIAIKVTFYRMASNSLIGNALMSAAKNGKKVTVFIELKARFDEENNILWAEKMRNVGVKIIYSIVGLKVHAKVALVKKRMESGKIKNYCFFATGNLNEKTAPIYADYGLLTCHAGMGLELNRLFEYLLKNKDPRPFKHLLVSQFNMVDRYFQLIDREIKHVKMGLEGRIIIKLNNLEERGMIDKLYEASQAGVKIELIVRSICCLVPGVKGMSEHIKVRRIVGRFLEHARVFWFSNNGKDELYMGSADWMRRNLYSRIEVSFPILNEELKTQIKEILMLQLQDNTKAVFLDADQNNNSVSIKKGEKLYNAQLDSYYLVKRWEEIS